VRHREITTGKPGRALLPCVGVLLVCALASGACNRNIEPFVADEEPRTPNLEKIFPAPEPAVPSRGATAAAPPGMPAAPQRGNVAKAPGIRGSISVSPDLASGVFPTGTLFVIARKGGVAGGPPLAVLRIAGPQFPVSFEIGQEQVMIPGLQFQGEIQITARLDSDGNPMTKLPGDLAGIASTLAVPGTDGLRIVLDSRI